MSTEIAASPSRALSAPSVKGTALQQLRGIAAQPAVVKSIPALAFIALAGIAAMLWMAFSTAPSRDLFRGLPDEDKAAVTEALRGAGIAYDVDRDSGSLTVSEDEYHQAKMLLAAQGLPKSAPDGNDMISGLPLGASRAVESERLRSARELDLARTIEAIDAIQSARVHLALEQPSAFLRERSKPAASVMLTLAGGRTLGDQQVQAIVNLVASSVPGMSPDGVSVADQNGRLLSQQGGGGSSGEAERQVAVQGKIEERYRRSIETLLLPILGAGNFTAQVHADVDFSETQATREGFPKEASALRAEEGAITTAPADAEAEAGGIPGALSNEPPAAAQITTTPGGQAAPTAPGAPDPAAATAPKRSENYTRNFAVGREVSVTRQQTGQVKRISVAVVLKNPEGGKPRSAQEIAAFEKLVKGAIGFDASRGDVVALSARSFVAAEAPAENWWEAGWVGMLARNLTALAVVALLVFGFAKPLMKRGSAALAKRAANPARGAVGGEIAAAIAHEARTSPDTRITLEMIETANSYETRAALIRNFVRQDPARAALVVRDLIRSDSKDGDKDG